MDPTLSFIRSSLLTDTRIRSLNNSFRKNKPFPHIVISNFLKKDVAEVVATSLSQETFIEKESDLFHMFQTDDLYFSKNSSLKSLNDSFLQLSLFSFIEQVTGVSLTGTLSMAGSKYEPQNYLLCHDDKVEGRRIAYLLYLSKGFRANNGGRLQLYSSTSGGDAHTVVTSISPTFNTLVLFEVSGKSFHAVEENFSRMNRYAIGGWFS